MKKSEKKRTFFYAKKFILNIIFFTNLIINIMLKY